MMSVSDSFHEITGLKQGESVRKFPTSCFVKHCYIRAKNCLACEYRDQSHDHSIDGMIYCTYVKKRG
jgi:hypothetical protein